MAWEEAPHHWQGLPLGDLDTDQAFLRLGGGAGDGAVLYAVSENCHRCPWQLLLPAELYNGTPVYRISTHHSTGLLVRSSPDPPLLTTAAATPDPATVCRTEARLGEFGVYDLDSQTCQLDTALQPVTANLALLVCGLVVLAAAAGWWLVGRFAGPPRARLARLLGWNKEEEQNKETSRPRLRSLDTFRGIAISLMIFVNDGGGGYWFMEHATWNGLYVADLVFPWFIWIMGVCIPMSVRSAIKRETPVRTVVWQVTVRAVKLFLLGFILNTLGGWIQLGRLRVPGVLQRFGITYWVTFLLGFALTRPSSRGPAWLGDLTPLWPAWLAVLVITAAHQLLVWLVPAPGCQAGYAGPGGLHDWTPDRNNRHLVTIDVKVRPSGCIGGITGYVDRAVFSVDHIYGNPTAKTVYSASAFDPEGILGCLPSVLQVWLGYQAGSTLLAYPDQHGARLGRWLGWAALTGAAGAALCGASQEDGLIPINKNLWSLSFVLVTSCFAFLLLSLLYCTIDLKHYWKGQPFFYAGMNSILLYCGHSVGYNLFPFHFMAGGMRAHAAKLPETLWGTTLWLVIAFVLYRKKVFVTV